MIRCITVQSVFLATQFHNLSLLFSHFFSLALSLLSAIYSTCCSQTLNFTCNFLCHSGLSAVINQRQLLFIEGCIETEKDLHWLPHSYECYSGQCSHNRELIPYFCQIFYIFSLYTLWYCCSVTYMQHLLHVCLSWERDSSSVALPEVSFTPAEMVL